MCAWTLCLSTCPHLGGMIGCPSKLVPIGFELPLGRFMKGHRPFPPYLSLSIFFPLIHPLNWFEHWVCQDNKGLYLTLWEEGAKGPEGKSSWQEIKAKRTSRRSLTNEPRRMILSWETWCWDGMPGTRKRESMGNLIICGQGPTWSKLSEEIMSFC